MRAESAVIYASRVNTELCPPVPQVFLASSLGVVFQRRTAESFCCRFLFVQPPDPQLRDVKR